MFDKKIQLILIYFILSLVSVILYGFNPAEPSNFYPPSLTREWGSFYCAGCGTFRGLHQLLNGNWQGALRFNPLLAISIPYFFYWIIPGFLKYFYGWQTYAIKRKNMQIIMATLVTIIYSILRNSTAPSLAWLVPPA